MTIQNVIGKYKQPNREWYTRAVSGIKVFSIHHDAIPQNDRPAEVVMQQIFTTHKNNGWPGMSYHYYIHRDGTVYQVNKHEWVTWVDGVNWDCIGIVLNGYFHTPHNNKPTQAQLKALKELLDWLSTEHPELPADQSGVYAHRERAATSCPGDNTFPYVKEYREKLGDVNWGATPEPPQPPITADAERALKILREAQIEFNHGNLEGTAAALRGAAQRLPQIENDLKNANARITRTQDWYKTFPQ